MYLERYCTFQSLISFDFATNYEQYFQIYLGQQLPA